MNRREFVSHLTETLGDFNAYWLENGTKLEGQLTKPFVSDLTDWLGKEAFCCEFHDALPEEFKIGAEPGWDECGLAGMGHPIVCCRDCPGKEWFTKNRGMSEDNIIFALEECSIE